MTKQEELLIEKEMAEAISAELAKDGLDYSDYITDIEKENDTTRIELKDLLDLTFQKGIGYGDIAENTLKYISQDLILGNLSLYNNFNDNKYSKDDKARGIQQFQNITNIPCLFEKGFWCTNIDLLLKYKIRELLEDTPLLMSYFTKNKENYDLNDVINKLVIRFKTTLNYNKMYNIDLFTKYNSLSTNNGTLIFDDSSKMVKFYNNFNLEHNAIKKIDVDYDEKAFNQLTIENNEFFKFLECKFQTTEKALFICALIYNWCDTKQESIVIPQFLGEGSGGKSTFLNILSNFFYRQIPISNFKKLIGTFNDDSDMLSSMVMIQDSDMSGFYQNETFKKIAGREPIEINKKYIQTYQTPVLCKIIMAGNEHTNMKYGNAEIQRLLSFSFSLNRYKPEITQLDSYFKNRGLEILHCLKLGFDFIHQHNLYNDNRAFYSYYVEHFKDELIDTLKEVRKDTTPVFDILKATDGEFISLNSLTNIINRLIENKVGNFTNMKSLTTQKLSKILDENISLLKLKNVKKFYVNNNKTFNWENSNILSESILDPDNISYSFSLSKGIYYVNLGLDIEELQIIYDGVMNVIDKQFRRSYSNIESTTTLYENYLTLKKNEKYSIFVNDISNFIKTQSQR